MTRGVKAREPYLEVTLDELRDTYSGLVGHRATLLLDERPKPRGPARYVAHRIDVTGSFPGFLACRTVPDRRGRTRRIDVSYSTLLCGEAVLEEVEP